MIPNMKGWAPRIVVFGGIGKNIDWPMASSQEDIYI